jgi:hypothetical protein
VPFLIPASYVILTIALVYQLDRKNEQLARHPETIERLATMATRLPS